MRDRALAEYEEPASKVTATAIALPTALARDHGLRAALSNGRSLHLRGRPAGLILGCQWSLLGCGYDSFGG